MKVLNFIWGYGPGGVDKCFLSYAKCDSVISGLQVASVCVFIEKDGVDLNELNRLGVKIFRAKTKYDLSWAHDFNAFVDAENFDLAFMHASHNTAAFLSARLMGFHQWIPIVRSRHGEFSDNLRKKPLKHRLLAFIERFFLGVTARGIVAVSQAVKDNMVKHGIQPDKITVIYNGVADTPALGGGPSDFSAIPSEAVKFIAVARLVRLKGIDLLMDGFAKAVDANPAMHLIIVGDGPERESLQAHASKLGLGSKITFAGNQTNVADWLVNSDVYCLTSHTEAFPIGLLEAMRAGLPSIVSRVGGIPEAVTGKEAIIVKPGDVDEIATAILNMAADAGKRKWMGENARKRYEENYTENKMCENIARWLKSFDCQ